MQPDDLADIVVDVLRPLVARLAELERKSAAPDPTQLVLNGIVSTMRERIAVLEVRAPIPGPPGAAGRDGIDGVGFGDLTVDYDGERTFTIRAIRDAQTKELGRFTVPAMLYRGTWTRGDRAYTTGDVVSYAGSGWVCLKDTTTQPDTDHGAGFWKLFVKRGDRGSK